MNAYIEFLFATMLTAVVVACVSIVGALVYFIWNAIKEHIENNR